MLVRRFVRFVDALSLFRSLVFRPMSCSEAGGVIPRSRALLRSTSRISISSMTSPRALSSCWMSSGKGEMFGRVAHGDGAAGSVQIDARCSGDLPQDAEHFGHVLRAGGCGERKGLLRFRAILPPLLRRVWSDKHQCGIQWAPKGSRLRTEEGHGG